MNETFVYDLPREEVDKFMDLIEMEMTLNSLVLQIAKNNDIL